MDCRDCSKVGQATVDSVSDVSGMKTRLTWTTWPGEGIPLKQLILKNCALDKSSAEALGQLLRRGTFRSHGIMIWTTLKQRRCHYLEDLVLAGNQARDCDQPINPPGHSDWCLIFQALFQAPALILLLRGLEDEGWDSCVTKPCRQSKQMCEVFHTWPTWLLGICLRLTKQLEKCLGFQYQCSFKS